MGSLGRLGVMTELTFKVFPKPQHNTTTEIECGSHEEAVARMADAASSRWELDAIDYQAARRTIWIRIGGEASVCDSIASDIGNVIIDQEVVSTDAEQANDQWQSVLDLSFGGPNRNGVAKVPLTLSTLQRLALWCDDRADRFSLHGSVAGSIGWLSFQDQPRNESFRQVDSYFKESNLTGLLSQNGCRG